MSKPTPAETIATHVGKDGAWRLFRSRIALIAWLRKHEPEVFA